jgi:hypothetical protein
MVDVEGLSTAGDAAPMSKTVDTAGVIVTVLSASSRGTVDG